MIVNEMDLTGKTLSNYKIIGRLGKGGMATVYKAHELSLNRVVALKVLSPQLSEDKDYIKRFQREAQAAAQLNHPHIVQVYAIGEEQGVHYFAMEYIKGDSLADLKQDTNIVSHEKAVPIIIQVAEALGEAHKIGLVHRDIKPSNIMLDNSSRAKVTDFGIAYISSAKTKLTREGSIIGTPEYLSPEQCEGKTVDQRSDIYSLGVTLYELLSGKTPYEADTPVSMLMKIVKGEFPPLIDVNPNVPETLRNIVDKMMETDVNKRYGSMADLIADLQRFMEECGEKVTSSGIAAGAAAAPPAAEDTPNDSEHHNEPSTMTYQQLEIQENVKSENSSSLATFWAALIIVLIVGGAFAAKVFYFDKQAEKKQTVAAQPPSDSLPSESTPVEDTRKDTRQGNLQYDQQEEQQKIQQEVQQDNRQAAMTESENPESETNPPQDMNVTAVQANAGTTALPQTAIAETETTGTGTTDFKTATGPQSKTTQTGTIQHGTIQPGTTGTSAVQSSPNYNPSTTGKIPVKPRKHDIKRPQAPPRSCLITIEGDEEKSDLLTPYVQDVLSRKSFTVVDAPAVPDRKLADVARNLIVVKVRNMGSTTLQYYGNSTEQYTIQLVIKAVDPKTGTLIAGPVTRTVKYTALNAEENLREAVTKAVHRLIPKLRARN
jgi:serine/threonine protein kinase